MFKRFFKFRRTHELQQNCFFSDGEEVDSNLDYGSAVDKVFNTTATMLITPTEADTMATYKCEIRSVALQQPLVQEIGLRIIGKL